MILFGYGKAKIASKINFKLVSAVTVRNITESSNKFKIMSVLFYKHQHILYTVHLNYSTLVQLTVNCTLVHNS